MLLLTPGALAATLTVGPSGMYATIGEAEDAAVSGDVIDIGSGVWFETLDPGGKDLNYESSAGAILTAVEPCLSVSGGEAVSVTGLTFYACSGAIVAGGTSRVTVRDSAFQENDCGQGCGILARGSSSVDVSDTTFTDGHASGIGGSIAVTGNASLTLARVDFSGGTSDVDGGEVAFSSGGDLALVDVTFASPSATGDGGAIWVTAAGSVTLEGITIAGASANRGAGAWIFGASAVLSDLSITDPVATDRGAGLWFGGSDAESVTVTGLSIEGGVAGRDGGGLYATDLASLTIDQARFVGGSAQNGGGGASIESSGEVVLDGAAFVGNDATLFGGGLYVVADTTTLAGVVFSENTSGAGGGLWASGTAFTATNATWSCNTAPNGAGAAITATSVILTETVATGGFSDGWSVSATTLTAASTDAWGNTGSDWANVTSPVGADGNVSVDPLYRFVTCDLDWTNDDLFPDTGSPLIDVGVGLDGDGSVSDLGAYGGGEGYTLDVDGDGFSPWSGDCHDGRDDAFPGGTEVWYDDIDQDCDGNDDDQDRDGYDVELDCDDTDVTSSPGGTEVWYDGVDQDCDGNDDDQDLDSYAVAEDCDDTDPTANPTGVEVWYDGVDQDCDGNDDDQDVDGYGLADDCDDENDAVNPGRTEVWYDGVDQDCDGNDDDQDEDGYAYGVDCDDRDATSNPGATESWYDGVDQDCDGNDLDQDEDGYSIYADDCDDTDPDANPGAAETWYDGVDQDCDGNDDDRDEDGYAGDADDCDDDDATVNPGATETWYDGTDQDCDGSDDDQDEDGWPIAVDCDDEDDTIFPGATETWYDGVDQDCLGDDDDDQDGDGETAVSAGGTDCDDTDDDVYAGATEVWYDGIDQDCDGNDDDQDGDESPLASDCDDTDPEVHPGADEVWYDGIDQDCDGNDLDRDGDGHVRAEDCDDTDAAVQRCIEHIDGGCDATGTGPGGLLALIAALLVRRPRRAWVLGLLALPGTAAALDATGSARTPVDPGAPLRVNGMPADAAGDLDVSLSGGWAGTTAEATWDDGSQTALFSGLATAQLGVGWTFLDGVRAEAGLPTVLAAAVPKGYGPAVGDAWVSASWAALRTDAIAFGPAVELTIPTGAPKRLAGGGGVGAVLLAAASGQAGVLRWSGELGGGVRAAGSYEGLEFTPEPELRLGGAVRVTLVGPISAGAEVTGRVGMGAENAVTLSTSGAEALLSTGLRLDRFDVVLGGGFGLIDGVGTPDGRVQLAVRARLGAGLSTNDDADVDGIADELDRCPEQAEDDDGFEDEDGCPDLDDDADLVEDTRDKCPSDPEDKDGFRDDDGCPDLDDDGDGLQDRFDRCPRDFGAPETNGCPDRDRDGLLDTRDECPDDPVIAGTDLAHTDGCPGRVAVLPDRVWLDAPLAFDRTTLRPESLTLLREVAKTLQRWPDLGLVEIAVHTDDAGDDAANLKLSQQRAEAVKKALVAAGVADSRLVAQGYGETRPIAPNDTETNRALNRRVELVIVRR